LQSYYKSIGGAWAVPLQNITGNLNVYYSFSADPCFAAYPGGIIALAFQTYGYFYYFIFILYFFHLIILYSPRTTLFTNEYQTSLGSNTFLQNTFVVELMFAGDGCHVMYAYSDCNGYGSRVEMGVLNWTQVPLYSVNEVTLTATASSDISILNSPLSCYYFSYFVGFLISCSRQH
jgi:hypothetical protein